MPPVVGETVKPGGSNLRKIGRDLYRRIAMARGTLSISRQKPGFCPFVAGAAGRGLKGWFTNRESGWRPRTGDLRRIGNCRPSRSAGFVSISYKIFVDSTG
jgi:hypothetical protein